MGRYQSETNRYLRQQTDTEVAKQLEDERQARAEVADEPREDSFFDRINEGRSAT